MAVTCKNLAILAGVALLTCWNASPGRADDKGEKARKTRLVVSGVAFGAAYAGTIIGDRAIDSSVNFSQLYVPVIGPFLALGKYGDKVDPDYSGRTRDKVLFVLSGAVQAASALVFALNLKSKDTSKATREPQNFFSNLSIGPDGRGGFVAAYRLCF
jgi:hypothetical protein